MAPPCSQDAAGMAVLGCAEAGPGCGLSEEPMSGVRSVTPELCVVPDCPPRARRFSSFLVGGHAGEDDVGQASFEGAHGHHRRHPAGLAGVVVDAACGLVPELDDGHDVQCPVDPPVPGAGEPVALLVTGGGVQRRGAVPGANRSRSANRRRVLPTRSRGLMVATSALACWEDRNCLAPPANSSSNNRCRRLIVCV